MIIPGSEPGRKRHRHPGSRHALRSHPAAFGHAHRACRWRSRAALFGSSYNYVKAVVEASFYRPMPRGHALGFHLFVGGIVGDAPYFDRFFIGDLNLLLPRRALGINFSTLSRERAGHVHRVPPLRRVRGARAGRVRDPDLAAPRLRLRRRRLRGRRACSGWPARATSARRAESGFHALPIDLTGDLGIRLDTYVGIFTISIANALSRTSF